MTPQAEMVLWLFNGLLAGMLLTLSVGYVLSRPERWPPFLVLLAMGTLLVTFAIRLVQQWAALYPDLTDRWPTVAVWVPFWQALARFLPGVAIALVWSGTRAARRADWRGPLLLVLVAWVGAGVDLQRPVRPWATVVGVAGALGWLSEVRRPSPHFRPLWHGLAVLGFVLTQLLQWPGSSLGLPAGSPVEPLAYLGFLAAFSFAYEVFRGPSLMAEFFVRLNWLFILLAATTMLIAERGFRYQYMELTRRQLWDFVETLRGILAGSVIRGATPETALQDAGLLEEVVQAFSRYPDLRAVALQVRQSRLEIDIDPEGAVEIRPVPAEALQPIPLEGRMEAHVGELHLDVPIVYREATVGAIRMKLRLHAMFQQIFRSLLPIFGAFTAAVIGAGLLIGVVLFQAQRTIERQFREIHRANLELLQAAKLATLGELVASVAHDVATPLGSLLLGLDAIDDRLAESSDDSVRQALRQDVALLKGQVLRASGFIQHLLQIARAQPIEKRAVPVADLVRRALELVHSRVQRHRVRVVENGLSDLPPVWANEVQLEEVFLNVVNNAVDAMPDGGVLEIEGRHQGGFVCLRFTDTGPGIDPALQARVFEPFFTTKPMGTGLGLTVSRRIVEAHGGTIRIVSEVGRGTTVEVCLPVAPSDDSADSGGGA